MRIVDLGPPDCDEVASLVRASYADAFGYSMSARDLGSVMDTLTPDAFRVALTQDRLLGARGAGGLEGVVQWGPAPEGIAALAGLEPDAAALELRRLYVAPTRQGNGVGTALLDAALALTAAAATLLDVWERNRGALHLYRSRGFSAVAEHRPAFADGPAADADLVMLRQGSG